MTMENKLDEFPKRPDRKTTYEDEPPPQKKVNPLYLVVVAVVLSVLISVYWINSVTAGLVTKEDIDAKYATVAGQISQSLDSIPSVITAQVNTVVGSINTQVNNVANAVSTQTARIDGVVSSISSLTTKVDELNPKIIALQSQLASAEARIKVLETSPPSSSPSSSGGGDSIPNVSIDVKVTDEGTLQTSDNSTSSEIKLTFANNGIRDVEDVVVYLYAIFDDCQLSNQTIVSASYGSWTIRERQRDEIQIKGRIPRLSDGETRRIYIVLKSYANDYWVGNRVTYLDVSDRDLDIVDWNYGD